MSTSLKSVLLPDAFQIHCILSLDFKASSSSLTSEKNYNKKHLILNENRVILGFRLYVTGGAKLAKGAAQTSLGSFSLSSRLWRREYMWFLIPPR